MLPSRTIIIVQVILPSVTSTRFTRINFYKLIFYIMRTVIQLLLCYGQRSLFVTFILFLLRILIVHG